MKKIQYLLWLGAIALAVSGCDTKRRDTTGTVEPVAPATPAATPAAPTTPAPATPAEPGTTPP